MTRALKAAPANTSAHLDEQHQELLDLTAPETLFELAIEIEELLGHRGAKLIGDMKERAIDACFTHLCYRDPIRPGIMWTISLKDDNGLLMPTRSKLDQCRAAAEKAFPEYIASLEIKIRAAAASGKHASSDEIVMSEIPPITSGVSALELATALEYLVFTYPAMVRAWAALIFVYDQMLRLKEGAEAARSQCVSMCAYPQIVSYFLAGVDDDRAAPGSDGRPDRLEA